MRFLTDQQGVMFWYLAVDGSDDPPVIASYEDFGDPQEAPEDIEVWRAAPSFHAFMYRFWLENEIFMRTQDSETLSAEQSAYLREAQRLHQLASCATSGDAG